MERREQLALYIAQNQGKPFKWGEHDCCLFVARWLHKLGLRDITQDFIGHYNDKRTAAQRIKELGYEGVRDMAVKHLKPIVRPSVGDIAYFKRANALGICAGARYSYFVDNTVSGIMAVENKHLEFWGI